MCSNTQLDIKGCNFVNTLQFFITNQCNKRCNGCFYERNLGYDHVSLEDYKTYVTYYRSRVKNIKKINLLGGEPFLHPDLKKIIKFNRSEGLRTTIYTNGSKLHILENFDLTDVTIRVGILGLLKGEKSLIHVPEVNFPIDICYMINNENVFEITAALAYARTNFKLRSFMISNIIKFDQTKSVWGEHPDTLTKQEYQAVASLLKKIVKPKDFKFEISKRGVIDGPNTVKHCRFINLTPDGRMTLCPFDISLGITDDLSNFGRSCNKSHECCFQKIIIGK